jgi:hypothetical protein
MRRNKLSWQICRWALFLALVALASVPVEAPAAAAGTGAPGPVTTPRMPAPAARLLPLSVCLNEGSTLTACNMPVEIPAQYAGNLQLTLSPSYAAAPFEVTCVQSSGIPTFWTTPVECLPAAAAPVCPDGNVMLCDRPIGVLGGAHAGDNLKVPVPPNLLADPSANPNLFFNAQCVNNNGVLGYELGDNSDISCNLFACQAASLAICDTTMTVPGGAALGEVVELAAPAPYVPDHFRVQCLGSDGAAPAYVMMDNSGVSCRMAETPPEETPQ